MNKIQAINLKVYLNIVSNADESYYDEFESYFTLVYGDKKMDFYCPRNASAKELEDRIAGAKSEFAEDIVFEKYGFIKGYENEISCVFDSIDVL